MAKDAEAHAAEDKEQSEEIEARNGLDSLVYNIEKMLKESGDKVAAADKSEVESALAEAKDEAGGNAERGGAECSEGQAAECEPQAGRGDVQGRRRRLPTGGGRRSGVQRLTHEEAKKDEGVIDAEYVDAEK